MFIFGMFFPVIQSLWMIFIGLVFGYYIGHSAGGKAGYQQAIGDMQQQQSAQAFAQHIQNMMGGRDE